MIMAPNKMEKLKCEISIMLRKSLARIDLIAVIVAIVAIWLTLWCTYNIEHLFKKYNLHETIISLESSPPLGTTFPGVTVCAPSIFKPQKLAELFPRFNRILERYKAAQLNQTTESERNDFRKKQFTKMRNIFLRYETRAMATRTALDVIQNLSVQAHELLTDCTIWPINIRRIQLKRAANGHRLLHPRHRKCAEIVTILESIYEGKKCFTYFSDLYDTNQSNDTERQTQQRNEDVGSSRNDGKNRRSRGQKFRKHLIESAENRSPPDRSNPSFFDVIELDVPDDDDESGNRHDDKNCPFTKPNHHQMTFDLNPSIDLRLKPLENDIWFDFVRDWIQITVHPSNILQNHRNFNFFQLQRNNFYEISFTKKTTFLLPRPYKTECIYYRRDSIYEQFRTRDYCIAQCVQDRANAKCANYYSVLVERSFADDQAQHICAHKDQDFDLYLRARTKCEAKCPEECEKSIFDINTRYQGVISEDNRCAQKWWHRPEYNRTIDDDDDDDMYRNKIATSVDNRQIETEADADEEEDEELIEDEKSHSKNQNIDSFVDQNLASLHLHVERISHSIKQHPTAKRRLRMAAKKKTFVNIRQNSPIELDEGDARCDSFVSIRISSSPVIAIRHQPAITKEGFVGTIGGHFGVWLGLSLFKIIQFAIHVLYNLFDKCCR